MVQAVDDYYHSAMGAPDGPRPVRTASWARPPSLPASRCAGRSDRSLRCAALLGSLPCPSAAGVIIPPYYLWRPEAVLRRRRALSALQARLHRRNLRQPPAVQARDGGTNSTNYIFLFNLTCSTGEYMYETNLILLTEHPDGGIEVRHQSC